MFINDKIQSVILYINIHPDQIIIALTSATLFILIAQILWSWYKSRPKLTIENLRININSIHRQGEEKSLSFDARLDIKNHSAMPNSILKYNLFLKEPYRELRNPLTKCRTIQGKTTEPLSLSTTFSLPNTLPKKEYDFLITFIDQHNKSYSKKTSVVTPAQYL